MSPLGIASGRRPEPAIERSGFPNVALAGQCYGRNPAFPGFWPHLRGPVLPRIMPWRGSIRPETFKGRPAMTMSVTVSAERANPLHGLLPLWVGVIVYAVLVLAGNHLLIDPDTLWHNAVGQWMLDHHAVPRTDIYSFTMRGHPWISMQWMAEVLYAKAYSLFGWAGPVVLAAAGGALTFALLARFL